MNNYRRIGGKEDPRPKHKYSRGDLVSVQDRGMVMVIQGRHGIVRHGLGQWECQYIVCPLKANQKSPDMRSWNAGYWYKGRSAQVRESELTLVKSGWYVE